VTTRPPRLLVLTGISRLTTGVREPDDGDPPLARYGRVFVTIDPAKG
jgi:hypothetical protein